MSKFNQNGKSFELIVETNEDNRDVVSLYVDGEYIDSEYVTLGSATHDMENISEVENVLLDRNGYNEDDEEEIVCPECGAVHKRDSEDGRGWWVYETGKWACDCCKAEGTVWYLGNKISSLSVEE